MATPKITKRDRYNALLNMAEVKANPDMVDFIKHELELLDKKNAKSGEKKVNEKLEAAKAAILDFLPTVERATVKQVMEVIHTDSCQFATSALTSLYDKGEGVIERSKEKGVSYYSMK